MNGSAEMMEEALDILIVDDDPAILEVVSSGLRAEGWSTREAATAAEALQLIEARPPEVALIDIRLGDMSGMDLLRRIKSIELDVACILLTGYSSRETAVEAINSGAYSYIEKPVDLSDLALAVRRAGEKVRAERNLLVSEQRFRSVAQLAPDGILILDAVGRIIFYNQAAEETFGYKRDEVIGRSVTHLITELGADNAQPRPTGVGGAEASVIRARVRSMVGKRKDGEEIPLEVSISSWRSGRGRLHSVIARDVSEARRAKEREERQARLAAVGQLAAGIAHDFNNTLNAITLYAEMLEQREHLTEGDRRLLDVIKQQSDRAAKLVTQILDFSRRSLLEPRPLDLVAFLREMESMVKRMLPETIEVVLEISPQSISVEADIARLQQVIMNLTINARDAMKDGGRLTYRLSATEVTSLERSPEDAQPPGPWARLDVEDTGCGIEPEHLAHIFEPFFTTKDPGEGTGLGLAQAYGIIEQHGGQIRVESAVDEGTCFSIYLPSVEAEEVGPEIEDAARDGHHETIMLIEDEDAIREGMAEILRGLRYSVITARDAESGLALFSQQAESIKVVITDMVLPDMHGNEITDRLSRLNPDLGIILMTGYPLGKGTKELQSKRVSMWLQKPVSRRALADAVTEVLEGRSRPVRL